MNVNSGNDKNMSGQREERAESTW